MYYRRAYTGESVTEAGDVGVYAARNIGEVLLTAMIHRDGPVAMLESAPMPEIADVTATTDLGTMTLSKMMEDPRSRMKAIAVVHKGKLVFEEYIGLRPWDNHVWASAAKTLNGILIHQLEEEDRLNLSAPVSAYLPELKETAWAKITVADVLHQRSGLDIREGSLGEQGHPTTLFYATFAGGDDLPKDASFMTSVKMAGKLREPGQLFEYSSINTFVLGMIVERITGKPFHDLVTERIWSRAGMEGDALVGLSPSGEPSAFGIFASRLRDMARYGMLYTLSWNVVAKERVVSETYLPKVYAASKPEIFQGNNLGDRMIRDFGNIGMGASYQWDAVFPDGDIYKSGRTGQCLYISPETDTVIVWFSSTYRSTLWVHAYAREIVKTVFRKK
jgi:CubicO group peptidase (beta-lactamase class C family)